MQPANHLKRAHPRALPESSTGLHTCITIAVVTLFSCWLPESLVHVRFKLLGSHVLLLPSVFSISDIVLASILHIWQLIALVLDEVINLLLLVTQHSRVKGNCKLL